MSGEIEFSAQDAPNGKGVSNAALQEQRVIESPVPVPNSVIIKLWGGGHLCFNPNNHTPIFSLLALVAILATLVVVLIIGIWTPASAAWMDKICSALGYGITGIIGAMVGSAATTKSKKKED